MKLSLRFAAAVAAFALTLNLASHAEVSAGSKTARPLITQKIDETKLVTLEGNTRPEARHAKNDRGAVSESTPFTFQLLLKRSPEQEKALAVLMEQLHTAGSANYHQWLTPEQFRESFGVAKADVDTVKAWAEGQGLHVNGATPTGLQIEVTGTVGRVNAAFHTEIHNVADRQGNIHMANISDPKIPAELAKVIVGPTTLNTFPAHSQIVKRSAVEYDPKTHQISKVGTPTPETADSAKPEYTFTGCGGNCYALVPGDIQTIYNLTPLYTAGYTGKGATIGLIEDTSAYKAADWTSYVSTFGLTSYGGSFTTNTPTGSLTCTTATDTTADIEAELDIEVATAAAPGAAVVIEACKDSGATFGGLIAIENLVNKANSPQVVSMSYGECEAYSGASQNASFSTVFQQAATQGVSVFVSAGDNGAASCDQASATLANDEYWSAYGLGVTGWGETPYNVAVGGTDFYDSLLGTNSTYWSSTNGTYFNSALSYIPEIPWNDSCASELLATAEGYATTYGTSGFCNNSPGNTTAGFEDTVAGGGGYSTCATGAASTTYVVSGTCAGYAQPSYQTGLVGVPTTVPAYGTLAAKTTAVRTIPDVSLFAANGVYSHYYVICYSRTPTKTYGGEPCTATTPSTWVGIGGTSASSPVMAGIQTLINQYVGSTTNGNGAAQGNPNYVYYSLAKTEYGSAGSTTCNSTNGTSGTSGCIFYDVTKGDINANCKGTYNCYLPSGTFGVGSTSDSAYQPAFKTGVGYDVASGIGSVNAYNLATNWKTAFPTTTALTVASATDSGNTGDLLTATVSAVTKDNGFSGGTQIAIIGGVTFYDGTTSIGTCTITTGAACTYSVTGSQLAPGSNSITAVYAGNNAYPGSTSSAKTITETDATSTTASANPTSILTTGSTSVTATVTDSTLASGLPTGTVTFTIPAGGGGTTTVGSCALTTGSTNSSCSATVAGSSLALGSNTITASYAGVTGSFAASSGTAMVTVTAPASNVLTFTAVSHNFGEVAVGTAATAFGISVKNTSTTTAYPFSLVFTPASGFTSATNCPASIAAGASCELVFYFTPTSTTVVTAPWSLTSQSGFSYSPSNGGTLTGGGTQTGGVSLTTSGHNFGKVTDGTTSPTYGVVLSNSTTSAVPLTLGSVAGTEFTTVNNCPATLVAGASCNIQFNFKPTAPGIVQTVYSISAGGQPITSNGSTVTGITLTGTGQ